MAVFPDFEYDIFISYRHNDNRSGWVTEFVNNLQEELSATIKEPVSVYFDVNPHDGLLETHNVDKSLEGKLKCLIFIPIISQTYCDTKSFAWQHEFVAFNKLAKEDELGRDIKLVNGNVASRILPVKIHDLDAEDKTLLESEMSGVLRAIEFIYKESGVNRPLKPTDSKSENQNKTDYRNQVNKVANAIKEIITSLKGSGSQASGKPNSNSNRTQPSVNKAARNKKSLAVVIISLLLVSALGYFLYPKLSSSNKEIEVLDKSIAVLPFVDMSPNHDQEYFGDGMAEAIIHGLGQVKNLKVIARSSSFQFKGKNEGLQSIGEQLGVVTALEGSIKKSGNKIRVTATLTKTNDGTQLWSETFDRDVDDYLLIQDEITSRIVGALQVSFSGRQRPSKRLTNNEEAMKFYQHGRYFFDRNGDGDQKIALDYLAQAVKSDSNFAIALAYLSISFGFTDSTLTNCRQYNQAALNLDPSLADAISNLGVLKWGDHDFIGAEKEFRKALSLESENARVLRTAGRYLSYLGYYKEGIELCRKAVAIDPLQAWSHLALTHALAAKGEFKEAIDSWSKENEISHRDGSSTRAHLLVLNGQPNEAYQLISKIADEQDKLFLLTVTSFALNQKEKANDYLQEFKKRYSSDKLTISELQIFCGRREDALRTLQDIVLINDTRLISIDRVFRHLLLLKGSPYLIPLRDDPKFKEICKKLNYPEIK